MKEVCPTNDPFGSESVEEVPLDPSPLVQVIAQVRFPNEPALCTPKGIEPIREALDEMFPIFRKDESLGIVFTPQGPRAEPSEQVVWRLQDRTSAWQVSVSDSFVSLDTRAYTSRTDFCSRFDRILNVIQETVDPVIYDRFGIRYVNRLLSSEMSLEHLRSEVRGSLAVPQHGDVSLQRSFAEALFSLSQGIALQARWAVLPGNTTTDPTIEPVGEESWMLDIDVFTTAPGDFEAKPLAGLATDFAEHAYRFFRWAMTDTFIDERKRVGAAAS